MKKLTSALAITVLAVSMVACAKVENPEPAPQPQAPKVVIEQPVPAETPATTVSTDSTTTTTTTATTATTATTPATPATDAAPPATK